MPTIKQILDSFSDKIAAKINALNTKIGEISPFVGLSTNSGNSLSNDAEGKLYFKERTPEEIAQAYESVEGVNRYSDEDKQTVNSFGQTIIDVESKTDNGGYEGTSQDLKNFVDGLQIASNQALQELYLKDLEGNILSTLSVAFLNNEGTTFFYNETTEKLELRNDQGEVLSEVPVSAFVANLANSIGLTGSTLSLKDTEGNDLATVTFTINNIQGLQQALSDLQQADADMLVRIEDNEDNIAVHEQRLNELPENVASSENVATAKQEAIDDQKIITVATSRDLANTDHKAILLITANVTLNYPGNLINNFTFDIDVDSTGQWNVTDNNNGEDLDFPNGKILEAGKMGTCYVRPDGRLRGKGEFSE